MSLISKIKTNLPGIYTLLNKSREAILNPLIRGQRKSLRRKIEKHYKDNLEAQEVISFLKTNPAEMIPYFFVQEYKKTQVNITRDEEGFNRVKVNGMEIYFPKEMSDRYIAESVTVALAEQDERSPHKYLPVRSIPLRGDVAVLCGASDGIYAMKIVNDFKKIYLFEANSSWIAPMQKTLRDYLHKIEIVPYFISDKNGPASVTLDSFFKDRTSEEVNYIQADIEGDELKMLKGAKELLARSSHLKLSLCCYHTSNQEKELREFLLTHGFAVENSKGFLLLWMQYPLHPPYLRRGVLYAQK